MPDNVVICKKLGSLVEYYKEFKQLTDGLTFEIYNNDIVIRRAVKREIQLI